MRLDNNQKAFFALVKAGLWEQEIRLSQFGEIDFNEVYRLAEEQSVVGLVTAGFEHLTEGGAPQEDVLQFIGLCLQLEQRNKAMNLFIEKIVDKMRDAGIYTILVKGQGIAQCYEKPLWRAAGDVDFFLNEQNYEKAKVFLKPLADVVETENVYNKHQAMTMGLWEVELHGTMRSQLWWAIDRKIDEIQNDTFYKGNVRAWRNGKTDIFLPSVDNDVIFIFTHILQHFFHNGIGLRQVCDWCRLLWTYKDKIDRNLLESRLRYMGLMSEWKALAALAVDTLGMPVAAMPFYSDKKKWKRKANRIIAIIIETGNFGHNRDYSYYGKYPYVIRKFISLRRHTRDNVRHLAIFPMDSLKVWGRMVVYGMQIALQGKF